MQAERVLAILPNWLGDGLFTSPAVHVLRENFPRAHLAVMAWPGSAELFRNHPDADEVIEYEERGAHQGLAGKLRLIRILRKRRFDIAFLFSRSRTRALLSLLAGIPRRVGYATRARRFFLTLAIEPPAYDSLHRVDYYLGMVRGAGLKVTGPVRYGYRVAEADRRWAEDFFHRKGVQASDLKIVLNPGGNWAPKRWSAPNFAKLAKRMIEAWGAKVILTGVAKDKAIFEELACEAGPQSKFGASSFISAVGETARLGQLAALLEAADLYIGNDSGPTHLAHSLETPLIALFGPQDPAITGPYGPGPKMILFKNKGCKVPCYLPECDRMRCIDEIGVDEVFEAAGELLRFVVSTSPTPPSATLKADRYKGGDTSPL